MTEKQKQYFEKLGCDVINLENISRDDLSDDDKEFIDFIESTGGTVTEIFHF